MRTIAQLDLRQVLMVKPAARTSLFKYEPSSHYKQYVYNKKKLFLASKASALTLDVI